MATASVMMSSMSLKPAPRGLPSLGTTFRVVASGVKKIKTDTPYGTGGGMSLRDGLDASGRKGKLATNTLERVAPLTHAVGNVLKRVFVIGFSIIVFGNRISTQTGIGTCIAIAGVAIYSFIKAKMEEEKRQTKAA